MLEGLNDVSRIRDEAMATDCAELEERYKVNGQC